MSRLVDDLNRLYLYPIMPIIYWTQNFLFADLKCENYIFCIAFKFSTIRWMIIIVHYNIFHQWVNFSVEIKIKINDKGCPWVGHHGVFAKLILRTILNNLFSRGLVCIYVYAHISAWIDTYVHMYTYISIYLCRWIPTYICKQANKYIRLCIVIWSKIKLIAISLMNQYFRDVFAFFGWLASLVTHLKSEKYKFRFFGRNSFNIMYNNLW